MSETPSLQDASVQDIQLELLRRSRWNDLDGPRVYASLMSHRALWLAAMLDRPGTIAQAGSGYLTMSDLIKLRDLPDDCWNVDTLYILTATTAEAHRLARIAEEEEWGGEVFVHQSRENISRALGTSTEYGLLSIWWD
jgi:hypothetical protein